jgi:hypothetical protein
LDKGINTTILGELVNLAVFTFKFLLDMVEGNVLCGIKGVKANKNCRMCYAGKEGPKLNSRRDLSYDIFRNGRYHYQTIQMRKEMASKSLAERAEYSTKWGLDVAPVLQTITPALDLVLSRPFDLAHSEYQGLSQLMHELLKDTILTAKGLEEYYVTLRQHPFPPGWARLQSPIHYLGSYSLAEHARWSIIIPGLLRCWLQRSHIKPVFLQVAQQLWENPLGYIVGSYAAIAKSNSVLMGPEISPENRLNFNDIVMEGRLRYQELSRCAVNYYSKIRHDEGLATPA